MKDFQTGNKSKKQYIYLYISYLYFLAKLLLSGYRIIMFQKPNKSEITFIKGLSCYFYGPDGHKFQY